MKTLYEQYRPLSWAEVKGQDKTLQKIQAIQRRGLGGKSYWISGKSGTGKTTIARLLASEIADDFFIEEVDAQWITPARLRELEDNSRLSAWGKGGKAFIVNESHGLTEDAIKQFLVTLERIPEHVIWVFTTTKENQKEMFSDSTLAGQLLSRCIELTLAQRDIVKPMAERLLEIARKENLDGQPLEKYIKLLQDCGSNMRMALQKIEAGEMLA